MNVPVPTLVTCCAFMLVVCYFALGPVVTGLIAVCWAATGAYKWWAAQRDTGDVD
jgi:hypothetical protein